MAKQVKKGGISVSLYFLIVILAFFVVSPLPGAEWAVLIIGAFLLFPLSKSGIIKPFQPVDAILIPIYFIGLIILFIVAGFVSLTFIPWWKIILFGILVEAVSIGLTIFFPIPVVSDFIQGFITFAIGITLIGGIEGSLLSIFMFFVLLIPGHIPGVTVGVLIFLKLLGALL